MDKDGKCVFFFFIFFFIKSIYILLNWIMEIGIITFKFILDEKRNKIDEIEREKLTLFPIE